MKATVKNMPVIFDRLNKLSGKSMTCLYVYYNNNKMNGILGLFGIKKQFISKSYKSTLPDVTVKYEINWFNEIGNNFIRIRSSDGEAVLIEKGTTVEFKGGRKITVKGKLITGTNFIKTLQVKCQY